MDQALPVDLTLKFSATTSDLTFKPSTIDFGDCIMHEMKSETIVIQNSSALTQQFGKMEHNLNHLSCCSGNAILWS